MVADPRAALGTLASAVYGDPTAGLTVIGVTGTAGKTSTAYLIESGLRAAGHVTGLIGTVETRLGDLVIDSVRTTPEATDLHAMLAAAAERGVTAVVMEVSSHALAMGRVGGVRFTVGGWTNFGSDHLDFHADAEDYFAAKARLFDGRCAVEVLNHDDPALKALFKPATVSFSALGDRAASWWADEQTGEGYAQRFTAHGPDGLALPARVALPGRHNVSKRPAGHRQPGGRRGRPGDGALRELSTGRLICVIGAGGDRDRGKRPAMGAAAAAGADLVVVTDDNPRTEDPAGCAGPGHRGRRSPRGDRRGGAAGGTG